MKRLFAICAMLVSFNATAGGAPPELRKLAINGYSTDSYINGYTSEGGACTTRISMGVHGCMYTFSITNMATLNGKLQQSSSFFYGSGFSPTTQPVNYIDNFQKVFQWGTKQAQSGDWWNQWWSAGSNSAESTIQVRLNPDETLSSITTYFKLHGALDGYEELITCHFNNQILPKERDLPAHCK